MNEYQFFPPEIYNLILTQLPITILLEIKTTSKLINILSNNILQIHNNKFAQRVKLYIETIKLAEENKSDENSIWYDHFSFVFSQSLRKLSCEINNENKLDYYNLLEHNITNDYDNQSEYLEGQLYEYNYDNQSVDINCDVCKKKAFLPLLIKYTATIKDRRSDRRSYFPGYCCLCRDCFLKKSFGCQIMQSVGDDNFCCLVGFDTCYIGNNYDILYIN